MIAKTPFTTLFGKPAVLLLVVAFLASGCSPSIDQLPDDYGKRRGTGLNGLCVLSDMFRRSGARVTSWKRLSPKVEKQDVIVWAPSSPSLPTSDQLDYFDDWLSGDYNRTLILINYDYDAALGYWHELLEDSQGQQKIEIRRRLAVAQAKAQQPTTDDTERKCDWYSAEFHWRNADWAQTLDGDWANDLDASNVEIFSGTTLTFADGDDSDIHAEHVLMEGQQPLVTKITNDYWHNGCQVFVAANGSTLLNQPLVNHENRKIAATLIDECGSIDRVMFLEGAADGIEIRDTDASAPMMLQAFTVWPINFLMFHATMLGILFCICVFPIFGRPKELAAESVSDFGKHIAAYGELLQKVGGASFARAKLKHYRDSTHGGG
ncbi:MAG: hypothetical protein KDB27_10650 [Planctomycetales bacterium]|nr:hypothetical protein [Planctomycetales bacterium]